VLVAFHDEEETQAIDQRLRLLRHELHLNPHFEFEFYKCNRELRLAFSNAGEHLEKAFVHIDTSGNRYFRRQCRCAPPPACRAGRTAQNLFLLIFKLLKPPGFPGG